ncbi:uncharacterized protein N7498_000356 [Penicillium cinerascens]|uniref:LysM domain-containing protein n=1 Tax=Penicillium cinerascens TaxID=70096 RepID=A0A9W9NE95_9EURO|nr:uncharacterized protein N7498_000356 [Penicillium cinerascens]KAJ5218257.1 hypothetical protein N7498_000356 [Penicillium cinerascens]
MAPLRTLAAFAVALTLQAQYAGVWGNADTLYIYTSDNLAGISASEDCVNAMASNASCYAGLSQAVTDTTSWSTSALSEICTTDCFSALSSYLSSVNEACGANTQYNISGISQTASDRGKEIQWHYNATCSTDVSSGIYCNTLFQDAIANGTTDVKCSECYLNYISTIVNSQWGQDTFLSPSALERQVSSCSTSGYSVTYTATSTSSSTASASATLAASRCNTTDPDQTVYEVESGDTCVVISAAQNVSTMALINLNSLDMGCTHIVAGAEICLPDTLVLKPATTAVSVPTDAVTTSNTNCGHWYQIQDGDTCQAVGSKFSISQYDFDFLNPQAALNTTSACGSLWKGNSYCVQAVANINTYTSYTSNSSRTHTTLASTINPNATRTANHSTTHLFWSYPSDLTTTSAWISDSAWLASLSAYTLCDQVNSVYNITDDDLTDDMWADEAWLEEYERVCNLPINDTFPTVGFNFSITLTDDGGVGSSTLFTSSQTASPHASSTATTATSTTTAATPTSTISENGLCGPDNSDWTCLRSQFGDCCSNYGYCGSSSVFQCKL